MERIGDVVNAGSKARAVAVMVTATLAMGCCGGDHGSNPRATSALATSSGLPEPAGVLVPGRPVRRYGADVPLAYYALSFEMSKRTGGMTPPVQARIFAYMGLALYESLVPGMPRHRSIARHLHGIGELPRAHGRA